MKNEVMIAWLDIGIKYGVLIFSTYYFFMRCVSEKTDKKKLALSAFFSAVMGLFLVRIELLLDPMHLLVILVYIMMTNCLLYRNEPCGREDSHSRMKLRDIAALSLLSFAFCEAIFMIVGLVFSSLLAFTYYNLMPEGSNSVWDYLNNRPVHIASYAVMIFMVWASVYLAARMRRLRRGLMNIVEHRTAGTVIILAMIMLTVVISFGGTQTEDDVSAVRSILFFPAMAFCVVMVLSVRHEIKADYIGQIRRINLDIFERSLAEKDRKISGLADDNERLAEVIRRDAELLRQLSDGLKEADGAKKASGAVEKLYSGRCEAVRAMESYGNSFESTGVNAVDSILNYMACMAQNADVDFDVNVSSDMSGLIGRDIDYREFNALLADLAENAIISAGAVKEGRVEIKLMQNDGYLCLKVLDSGERFNVSVLKDMGKKRITTHSDEGGSGIGLMSIFRILSRTGASFTIEEFSHPESHDHYSKALSIEFDRSSRMRIITDRADELGDILRPSRFEIVRNSKL